MDVVSGPGYDRVAPLSVAIRTSHEIRRVVSNLAVMDFEASGTDTGEPPRMRLRSVHPGVTVEEVVEATGFELVVPDEVYESRLPTDIELHLLREVLDPRALSAWLLMLGCGRMPEVLDLSGNYMCLDLDRYSLDFAGVQAVCDLLRCATNRAHIHKEYHNGGDGDYNGDDDDWGMARDALTNLRSRVRDLRLCCGHVSQEKASYLAGAPELGAREEEAHEWNCRRHLRALVTAGSGRSRHVEGVPHVVHGPRSFGKQKGCEASLTGFICDGAGRRGTP